MKSTKRLIIDACFKIHLIHANKMQIAARKKQYCYLTLIIEVDTPSAGEQAIRRRQNKIRFTYQLLSNELNAITGATDTPTAYCLCKTGEFEGKFEGHATRLAYRTCLYLFDHEVVLKRGHYLLF